MSVSNDRRAQTRARSQRRLLINPRFQLTFLGALGILAVVVIIVSYAISRYFLHEFERVALEQGLSIDHALFGLLREQQRDMATVFGLTTLAVLVILTAGGLLLSHLIAGPLHRLELAMKREASDGEGAGAPVNFRKWDFFPELAAAFNAMLRRR